MGHQAIHLFKSSGFHLLMGVSLEYLGLPLNSKEVAGKLLPPAGDARFGYAEFLGFRKRALSFGMTGHFPRIWPSHYGII